MILNREAKQQDVETYGTEESIDMSIDSSDQAALMMILSENLYKDPIGSLVRESASNALDAQKKAGSTDPIIVRLVKDGNGNYTYSVTDHGTGITPEDVKNVLSKYAASTKRGSNEYLGYYGLGFKAPLAYVDSFVFITRVSGVEYQYLMYKGEKGTKIDLIDSHPTSDPDGTTVEITVKRNDVITFTSKIQEQLAYFEGVYFDTASVSSIRNDFHIIKSQDWKYSQLLGGSRDMHICLSDVYYDIDWTKLGMNRIPLSIGLNFSIEDGLMPVPSREDIKYTEDAKVLIREKIKKVADYFMTKFNEQRIEAEDFEAIYNKFNQTTVTLEGTKFEVTPLIKHSSIPFAGQPTLKGIKLLDLERLSKNYAKIMDNYKTAAVINSGTYTTKGWRTGTVPQPYTYDFPHFILIEESPKGVQLAYLKDTYPNAIFIRKTHDRKLGKNDFIPSWGLGSTDLTYHQLLHLSSYKKSDWREVIREYKTIEDSILNRIPKLEDLQPTEAWLEERKRNRKKGVRALSGSERIWIKPSQLNERTDWENGGNTYPKGEMVALKETGKRFGALIIYANKERLPDLQRLGSLTYPMKKRVRLAIVNTAEQKKLKGLKNFVTVEEFMEGKNKPFKVFATAILAKRLMDKNLAMFRTAPFFAPLKKSFAADLNTLTYYIGENYPRDFYGSNKVFLEEVLKTATEYNLFDEDIILVYNRVIKDLERFKDLDIFEGFEGSGQNEQALGIAREVLRRRKVKMDYENYLTNPPVVIPDESDEAMPGDDEGDDEDDGQGDVGAAPAASKMKPLDDTSEDLFEEVEEEVA